MPLRFGIFFKIFRVCNADLSISARLKLGAEYFGTFRRGPLVNINWVNTGEHIEAISSIPGLVSSLLYWIPFW
jgi:hypothetical protein